MIRVLVNLSFVRYVSFLGARYRAVGVATRLRAGRSGVRIPAGAGDLSLPRPVFGPLSLLVSE